MRFNQVYILLSLATVFAITLTSCFNDDNPNYKDYSEWREQNLQYITDAERETADGKPVYEKLVPEWEKSVYTLIRWHNERSKERGLTPISNSTVDVKYTLTNISGDTIDSSSSFRCRPSNMVTGFWLALTNMEPGDSVTTIVPYNAGYGEHSYSSILPYSTLIFTIKLDSIVAYQSLPWRN